MSIKFASSPPKFQSIIKENEHYIFHESLRENTAMGADFILLVTNRQYYKLLPENLTVQSCNSLKDIHSVEEIVHKKTNEIVTDDSFAFKLVVQIPIEKNKLRSTRLEDFLKNEVLYCETTEIRDLCVIVLRALLRNMWQLLLEELVMPKPEVYQVHRFVTKVNKKGRHQVRFLAISTERVYNLQAPQVYPPSFGKVKWSFRIASIHKSKLGVEDPRELMIVASFSRLTSDKEVLFIFKDQLERDEILSLLRYLFKLQTRKELPIVDHPVSQKVDEHRRLSLKAFYNL